MRRIEVTLLKSLFLASILCVVVPAFGATEAPRRLSSSINDAETFVLKGNTRPVVAKGIAQDLGPVAGSTVLSRITMHFQMTASQQADRTQLLAAQQNRRSPQFHKFLTPEQYADRFGLNTADVAKISQWLENRGFSNLQVARARSWVSFQGNAAQVESVFHTSIHNYTVNGEAHIANSTDPELPKELDGMVSAIRGLQDFRLKPHLHPKPRFTSSISGNTYLAPADWATIYDVKPLYNNESLDGSPITGEPYSIAVVGQSDVNASDLANFRTAAGLPAKTITTVVPTGDTDPGLQFASNDEGESDLDLEWSNGIAKNANILFVTACCATSSVKGTGNGVEDSIIYAIDNNVAPILSTSYGLCEPDIDATDLTAQEALFAQAATQGMTILAASGDAGAADCDTTDPAILGLAVDYPASSEYVTGIGGTTLQAEGAGTYFSSSNDSTGGSALSYIPEAVWNDTSSANGLSASGGGYSIDVAKPTWQTGTGVPNDGHRDVPDLAFTASPNTDGLLYCTPSGTTGLTTCVSGTFRNSDTTLNITGGTSTGPPTMSGIVAMLVQQQGTRLGLLNPNIYTLASISETAFQDITSGNNEVPCTGGTPNCSALTNTTTGQLGYSAGVGYDQTTGWGSLDAAQFVAQWSADITMSSTPATLTLTAGNSGTATVSVNPYKNFPSTGTVTFACSVASSLANVTCAFPNGNTTTTTATAVPGAIAVTINAASTAHVTPLPTTSPRMPPVNPLWLLSALLLSFAAYLLRKIRFTLHPRSLYACASAALLLVTLGVVSCGGGGSSSGGGGSTTTPLALSCSLAANAQVGKTYSGTCSASGGTSPYTYSISAGALPAGLTINSSTGGISGTPTTEGSSSFTVEATDSSVPVQTATSAQSGFTVAPPTTETGNVTVTATTSTGGIVNSTNIAVTVNYQ